MSRRKRHVHAAAAAAAEGCASKPTSKVRERVQFNNARGSVQEARDCLGKLPEVDASAVDCNITREHSCKHKEG